MFLMKRWISFSKGALIAATMLSSQLFAYSVVDRFKIIDDKLKTDAMLRPIGHDFIFDINASLNGDVLTFIKDISDASKKGTVPAAQAVLYKYENTEQTIKLNLNLGIPIFSFTAFGVKVIPNFRVIADVGANIGIRKNTLTAAQVLDLINVSVPATVKNQLIAVYDSKSVGADLFGNCNVDFATPVEANLFCKANTGKYFKPDSSIPDFNLFAKVDGKAGFFNAYKYGEHFFGDFDLYALGRTDVYQVVNYAMIQAGQTVDLPKKLNTELTLQTDYRLGYSNANYNVALGVEELKLTKLKAKNLEAKELAYGYKPLLRLHGEAEFRYSVLSLFPFIGVHNRSGYGLGEGVYVGATVGAHVWGDRIGLSFRGMADQDYYTLNPRIKLWLTQFEYSLKLPAKSKSGDVKLSSIQTVDFRVFF
jgi:hypothetical protein